MNFLTSEEKDRFAMWLEQEAHSYAGIVEQMKKININESVQKHISTKVMAFKLAAHELRMTKTETIK